MTDPTPLPAAQREAAVAKLKARDDGIRANAIKQGYAQRDAVWHKALGVASMAEATEIAHLRAQLKAAPTPEAMRHAQHGARNFGVAVGLIAGAALMLAAGAIWLAMYARQLNDTMHEGAITGATIQQLNPPQRCISGEHLADGRVCPSVQQ